LANICEKVYLIHRRDSFRAEPIRVEKAKQNPKIEFVLNSQVEEIYGNEKVE
jgi:thioredoxin reductase (NADPH)